LQIFNFSTTANTVFLNGKQIHPKPAPPPDILAHQVTAYAAMTAIDYDLSYSNYHPSRPLYPLSHIGYVVNVSSQAHPPGSRDSSLVTLDFRTIQVGSRMLDCLDSVELSLFQAAKGGPLAVKGARFKQNEESYLPDTGSTDNTYNMYDSFGRYSGKPTITASGFRKCHHFEPEVVRQSYGYGGCLERSRPRRPRRRAWSPTAIELFGIILAGFVGGVTIALLVVYFRVGLKKGVLRTGSAIRLCSVSVWRRLQFGKTGAIRLPTSTKDSAEGEQPRN